MPTTKIQKVVFTFLTVIITVHLFAFYNIALSRGGMSNQVFVDAPKAVAIELVLAFMLQMLIAGPLSLKIAFNMINPREEKPYIITTVIICTTVSLMCPMMSFAATIIHNGFTTEFLAQWLQKIVFNFPFAFFTQLFFIQPVVRATFGLLFKKKQIGAKSNETTLEPQYE